MSIHLQSVIRILNRLGNDDWSLVTYVETVSASDPTDVTLSETLDSVQSLEDSFSAYELTNSTIDSDDIKLYVDPSTCATEPTVDDKMYDGSTYYSIENVERYKEQDTVVLYILQIRA